MNINSEQLSPFLVEISSASQLLYLLHSFSIPAGDHTVASLGIKPRVLSDGVVPGEAKFAKEAGLTSWFQRSCVVLLSETSKLGIFEAKCGLASVSRGRLKF